MRVERRREVRHRRHGLSLPSRSRVVEREIDVDTGCTGLIPSLLCHL
jgi:hypothetical protein